METIDRADAPAVGSEENTSDHRSRWSRTHTIWVLIALSMLPGVAAALSRESWAALPTEVRWAAYAASAILIAASVILMLRVDDKRES
jgi:hypothetical protein